MAGKDPTGEEAGETKKKPHRRPIWVLVPQDIENLTDPAPEPEIEPPLVGSLVEPIPMPVPYLVYCCPAGEGQKKAVRGVLAKHNVDIKNVHRVKLFHGDKPFKVSTQISIRF